ncbi:MAG: class I and II aminotransferase [Candidatus Peregrinibacteria bacterium GW2011_GWF2_33_10]|nr:MAG: class I and II aminotransferase [Candidatus Peregrinibacteria bacterium GW2011_GWF2_33_10]OGJ44513.1 MAG: aspartate aminotransferase [Candidatus Peregrinibacteria bacterium RIFOXYA2_FULL_33_21]OGJ46749.1 MAG: aspartate aminotransferase [Candidatus Peregrinibacteria bacterium RIFOXYA12_FULL_33_12]OGJ50321.1 MAG: aspartate aminotransferase [Candidatus Peregrinibacteria bacterium RIFOXYB2_FULL_33_20]
MNYTLAKRISRLGTETAYAVSESASKLAMKGKKIYPFHLGDINLPTPFHIIEAMNKAIKDGKTGYTPAAGILPLRQAVADYIGQARGVKYNVDNVVIHPGGKPVIGKFLQVVMEEGDAVLYPNPGYPIYESQIEYFGGLALPYQYIPTKTGFKIDREQVENYVKKHKPTVLIYNNYQNPLGAESDDDEMNWIAKITIENNMLVLSDEAYFDVRYSGQAKSIVSIPGMQERTMILHTFSKTFAMTGWRLGASIGPAEINNAIAKINTNDEACTTHFIQYAGIAAIQGDREPTRQIMNTLRDRRDVLVNGLNSIPGISVPVPNTTFYLFVDITAIYNKLGSKSLEDFRMKTLEATGVSFCTREHFGKTLPGETRKFIRFAYSGINVDQIQEGLAVLKKFWM